MKTTTYKGFTLSIKKMTAIWGREYFVIYNETNKTVVARFCLKKYAIWHLDNFEKFPILPL